MAKYGRRKRRRVGGVAEVRRACLLLDVVYGGIGGSHRFVGVRYARLLEDEADEFAAAAVRSGQWASDSRE